MTDRHKLDMTNAQVVTLTIEVPGSDDMWFEIELPILRAALLAAAERFRQRSDAAKDTTTLDWDDLDGDILSGCLYEYQRWRFYEDKTVECYDWMDKVPPF